MSHSAFPAGPENRLAQAIRRCLGLSLSGALLTLPLVAQAQEEATEASTDTMVVVGTALKVEAPLVETPRPASVVTREELDERNVQQLDETFRYRAGVLSGQYGSDNDTDWFKVRGFDQSTYLDSSRLFVNEGYYRYVLEPFGLERVELLKGPSSVLYGEAPPGGVVNAVSKRPTQQAQGMFELQAGNRDHRQVGIDSSGPVTKEGDVRYRVVGLYKERDGDLEHTENERYFFAPSLAVELSEKTSITFLASIQKDDAVPTNGFKLPYGTIEDTPYGKIDPSTNLGEPGYDKNERTQISVGYQLDHQINDTWDFQQNLRYGELDLELRSTYVSSLGYADPQDPDAWILDGRSATRGLVYRDGTAKSYTIDNRLVGNWYGDRTENTFLVGVDYQRLDISSDEVDVFSGFGAPIDLFDPVYGQYTQVSSNDLVHRTIEKEQFGVYVQDQLRLDDRWVFLAGARYDQAETSNETAESQQGYDEDELTFSGGVMYLSDNGISPYLSYTESFSPEAGTDSSGDQYEPRYGEQWEAGIKYAPAGFDGYVTAAVFDLTEKNALYTAGSYSQSQTNERRSRGFELEGVGYLTDNLKLIAAYTYTDAEIDVSEELQDQRAALIPRHAASAWLDYEFEGGTLNGLTLGGGARYIGESTDTPPSDITVDSVTLYDAMARYDFSNKWRAQLNVNNLTDKEYVASCEFWCYYGESRSVIGSLKYRW